MKGLVKLFAILFGLICIYQLSFTYVAGRVEDEAKAFAEAKVLNTQADYIAKREAIEAKYLDDKMGQEVDLKLHPKRLFSHNACRA